MEAHLTVGGDQRNQSQVQYPSNPDPSFTKAPLPADALDPMVIHPGTIPSYSGGAKKIYNQKDMQSLVDAIRRLTEPSPNYPPPESMYGIQQGSSFNF